mmetsp:Transcript_20365/g.64063  ORF Transcript_20365/g.64063 Transcript_20365/m.64063 type:complete len:272 (-) Transcript_20365:913-1728(-)
MKSIQFRHIWRMNPLVDVLGAISRRRHGEHVFTLAHWTTDERNNRAVDVDCAIEALTIVVLTFTKPPELPVIPAITCRNKRNALARTDIFDVPAIHESDRRRVVVFSREDQLIAFVIATAETCASRCQKKRVQSFFVQHSGGSFDNVLTSRSVEPTEAVATRLMIAKAELAFGVLSRHQTCSVVAKQYVRSVARADRHNTGTVSFGSQGGCGIPHVVIHQALVVAGDGYVGSSAPRERLTTMSSDPRVINTARHCRNVAKIFYLRGASVPT